MPTPKVAGTCISWMWVCRSRRTSFVNLSLVLVGNLSAHTDGSVVRSSLPIIFCLGFIGTDCLGHNKYCLYANGRLWSCAPFLQLSKPVCLSKCHRGIVDEIMKNRVLKRRVVPAWLCFATFRIQKGGLLHCQTSSFGLRNTVFKPSVSHRHAR